MDLQCTEVTFLRNMMYISIFFNNQRKSEADRDIKSEKQLNLWILHISPYDCKCNAPNILLPLLKKMDLQELKEDLKLIQNIHDRIESSTDTIV